MDSADMEAIADMDVETAELDEFQQQPMMYMAPAAGMGTSALASTRDDAADAESDETATESDEEGQAAAARKSSAMPTTKPAPNRRSRASSPDWLQPLTLDDKRLTARQRARLEKEAGLAEDVQWHEMDMPAELAYTWKGKGKPPNQMTEEEWLKRQEGLERRRMRSLRDKREAEETVKAKIRKAVTARFRGKLGTGAESGTEAEPGGEQAAKKEASIKPGWVKVKHNSTGCTIAWHPNAHPLSYPLAVVASGRYPAEPVDLPLQPPAGANQWSIPEQSSNSFKLGCSLTLQQSSWSEHQQHLQQPDQQQQLWCVDQHGWGVGCLLQRQVEDALLAAGYEHQQQHLQLSQGVKTMQAGSNGAEQMSELEAASCSMWQGWRAVVKSLRRRQTAANELEGVTVRLIPAGA